MPQPGMAGSFLVRKIPYELRCMHCMEGGWERSRRGSRVRNQRNSRSRQEEKQKEARVALGQGTRMRKEKGKRSQGALPSG